jgi:hypothetical protein
MKPSAKWPLCIFAVVGPLLPLAVCGAALQKLGSDSGTAWAHSLFMKDHALNFGGNPAEVLSHLLDWIVMIGGMAALCIAAATESLLNAAPVQSRVLRIYPKVVFPLTLILLTIWAHDIDQRSGEGTLLPVAVMFFIPFLLIITFGLIKLHGCKPGLRAELLPLPFLFGISLGLQWMYEPSGSGAPNLLMFPAFLGLTAGHWFYCYSVTHRRPPEVIAIHEG